MRLIMSGLTFEDNSVQIREKLAFNEETAAEMCRRICRDKNIKGCIILSTCNRTEIYLSCEKNMKKYADEILLEAMEADDFKGTFKREKNKGAVYYLIELACGLKSKIKGEEQITGQINNAARISRNAGCTDSQLNTLFRIAVTAGKYRMTNAAITGVPLSYAYEAVRLIEEKEGSIKGKRCIIIGNGKMGKIAQRALLERGCDVYVTLRSYKHGNNEIVKGCDGISYNDRYEYAQMCDYLISCTKSPHYTITEDNLRGLEKIPKIMIDIAMPRDIEPCVKCINIDEIGIKDMNKEERERIEEIVEEYAEKFFAWRSFAMSVKIIEDIKRITAERIIRADKAADSETVRKTAEKAVGIIFGAMSGDIEPEKMKRYRKKIKERSRL